MKKQTLLTLFTSAVLISATEYAAYGQPGPRAGAFTGLGRMQVAPPGPPAPVPAEVAMVRPTQAEVDQMNAALKKFIATSPEKELFTKYESLVTVQMPRANSAIAPVQTMVRTTQRHNKFVDIAKTNDFDILFCGDSITDFWQTRGPQGGAEVFTNYFGDLKVANFAISGDTTQGVLWGLQNGEGQGHKPKAIMLMIGTNNNAQGNTAEEIAEGVGAVVYELRKDFPDAKIMLLAIFPRGSTPSDSLRLKNDQANKIIAKLHDGKHVFFTDINAKFLAENGSLVGFRNDNLHPDAKGYEIWGQAVTPTLKSWIN